MRSGLSKIFGHREPEEVGSGVKVARPRPFRFSAVDARGMGERMSFDFEGPHKELGSVWSCVSGRCRGRVGASLA